jgi:hypothetical protein
MRNRRTVMSFELPNNIEKSVQQFAAERHLSHDAAVVKLIETGLQHSPKNGKPSKNKSGNLVTDALQKVEGVRAERTKELAELSRRDEAVGRLIGFLKDEPETVEAIRQAHSDRLQAMYGS